MQERIAVNNRMFACCRVICGDAFYGIKNAGGNPPATSAALVNGEAKGIAKGNPSTLGQPSTAERCFVYITIVVKPLIESLSSEFVQVVFLEGSPFTKELNIRRSLVFCLIFDGGKFHCAKEIRKLQKPIIGRAGVLVDNCVFSKDVLDCVMQCLRYGCLSVVVVNLNFSEFLKVSNIVEESIDQISFHSVKKPLCIVLKFTFLVCKGHIAERQMRRKDSEARKITFSDFNRKFFIAFMLGQKRSSMHGYIGKSFVAEVNKVDLDVRRDVVLLFVEYECNEVIARFFADVAGFVHKYRKLFVHCGLLKNENAGGNPPALGGRPFREDQLIYTTTQGVLSRCNYTRTHVLKHLVNRKGGECCGC